MEVKRSLFCLLCWFLAVLLECVHPLKCCEYVLNESTNEIFDCFKLNSELNFVNLNDKNNLNDNFNSNLKTNGEGTIALATFTSKDILVYSSYTIFINSFYSNLRKYPFKVYSEEDTSFSFTDKRWNKIGIVLDAFQQPNGWGNHLEYLVVLDADLIVVDFSFDVSNFISSVTSTASSPSSPSTSSMIHLFVSRDAADIANSGFMIVKNSPWIVDFFSQWWESRFDYSSDQLALNDLFRHLPVEERGKVLFLPEGEINTRYPVYQTFTPQSRILHLFGEINEIRIDVFKFAAKKLCQHLSSAAATTNSSTHKRRRGPTNQYPLQLGLSSAVLSQIAFERILSRWNAIKLKLTACQASQIASSDCSMEEIESLMERLQMEVSSLCGYGRMISFEKRSEKCVSMFLENYEIIQQQNNSSSSNSIGVMDHLARNLYAAFTWSEDSIETIERGEEVVRLQKEIIRSGTILASTLPSVIYRQSVVLLELSRMSERLSQTVSSFEEKSSLLTRTESLARSSLNWALELKTLFGESDYETHVKAKIDAYLFLGEFLISTKSTSKSTTKRTEITTEDGQLSEIENKMSEGLLFGIKGLQLSVQLSKECQGMKEEASSRKLFENTCQTFEELLKRARELDVDLSIDHLQLFRQSCSFSVK